ncbi:hypothetical protein ACTQ5P_11880, partial [Bacillota bacterium LCP21S3_G6]
MQHVSDERFTVQELLSEYLPSLPVAKRKKARPKPSSMDQIVVSHKGNVFRIHSNRTLQLNWLHDYQLLCNLRRASATDALTSGRLADQNGRPPDNPNSVLQLDH